MGSIKSNAVPLAVGAVVGYFVLPYLINMIKSR